MHVNTIYYFLSISFLEIKRNTAAARMAETPLGPKEFATRAKFSATLVGNKPELSPKRKKSIKPEAAIASPSSVRFHINLLIICI